MSPRLRYVGHDHPVTDAVMKVRGQLTYGSDLRLPGMLHAKLLLSPLAHAVVGDVDTARAAALDGVVGVYSHLNSPSRPYCRYRIVPGQAHCIDDETLFASTVRFVGDRVAAVVATSLAVATEAVARIGVNYEPRPIVLTPTAALNGGCAIHPGGNLAHEYDYHTGDALPLPVDAVLTETTVSTQRLHHAAMEPHMCAASWDSAGQLTIWSTGQSVFGVRTVVADLFGLAYNKVRVIKVPTGGSFGGKQEFILEPVVAFLAMQCDRPVRPVLDRQQCIEATMTRPAQRTTIRTAFSPAGTLLDMDVDTLLAAGGYATSSPDYAAAMAHKLTRLYRLPHYRHHGRVAYTNTPVAGGFRGWGAPDIVTCAEIHLDHVAAQLHIDPVALRLDNLVHPADVDVLSGRSLGDARVRECLQLGAAAFGWSERIGRPAGTGRFRRGVGVACGGHKNGMLSDAFEEFSTMTLQMNEDGSVTLNAALHEMGGGSMMAMRVIVAEELGIDPELVSVTEADSATSPYDYGCYGSRVTYVCGAAARAVAVQLKERLVHSSAVGGTTARRSEAVTLTYRCTTNPGSYSVQFAEVEVDVLTGLVRVTDFLAVADVGCAINPAMVQGQYRGAIQAGIGSALCEEVVLDAEGRPAQGGFKNYHLVNAVDMPDVTVLLVEHEGDDGPYGAKSVGEIASVPTAAAVINALNRALGTSITTLPATPERVIAALLGVRAEEHRVEAGA